MINLKRPIDGATRLRRATILMVFSASLLTAGVCAAESCDNPDYVVKLVFAGNCPSTAAVESGDTCTEGDGCLHIKHPAGPPFNLLLKWYSVEEGAEDVPVDKDYSIIFDPTMGPQHKSKGKSEFCKRMNLTIPPFANHKPDKTQTIKFKYTVATMKKTGWKKWEVDADCDAFDPVIIVEH